MIIPKNIATMTDAEHFDWVSYLGPEEHAQAARKTYRLVEWVISSVDEDGDIIETEAYSSLAEAEQNFNCDWDAAEAVVLERLTNHYSVLERDLVDREYKTLQTRGDRFAIDCGGF